MPITEEQLNDMEIEELKELIKLASKVLEKKQPGYFSRFKGLFKGKEKNKNGWNGEMTIDGYLNLLKAGNRRGGKYTKKGKHKSNKRYSSLKL
jgi:hypothetical protein